MNNYLKSFMVLSTMVTSIVFAKPTAIKCPIPYIHMKPSMFTIENKHYAHTYLKSSSSTLTWHVSISTEALILNEESISGYLRANQNQGYADLTASGYACWYYDWYPYVGHLRATARAS